MSFDSVFHGVPNSINFLSSGQASFGIDASAGILYFRTPSNGGWQKCANGTPGGLSGAIQFNNAGSFGGAASQVDAAGDAWFPGVVHLGNQSAFPTNPPGQEPDGWFQVDNLETRANVSQNYIGSQFFYTINPVSAGASYIGTLSIASTLGNTQPINNVNASFSEARIQGSGAVGSANAHETFAYNTGSGVVTLLTGSTNFAYNFSGGVVSLRGIYSQAGNAGSGAVTNNYGLYIESPEIGGLNSTSYGIYVNDQTVGSTNNPNPWGIFVAGGKCSFPIIIESSTLSPTSVGTAGTTGQIAWDSGKLYVCTAGGIVGSAIWKAATLTAV